MLLSVSSYFAIILHFAVTSADRNRDLLGKTLKPMMQGERTPKEPFSKDVARVY